MSVARWGGTLPPVTVEPLRLTTTERRAQRPALVILGVVTRAWVRGPGAALCRQAPPAFTLSRPEPLGDGFWRARESALHLVELNHLDELEHLPSLDARDEGGAPAPSRIRDAADLALRNRGGRVELALAEHDGGLPWALCPDPSRPELDELFDRLLDLRHGAIVLAPDAGGPDPLAARVSALGHDNFGDHDADARRARMMRLAARLGPRLNDRHQLLLLDDIPAPDDHQGAHWHLHFADMDVALCAWSGSALGMARHGWRSAAAALGGVLSRAVGSLDLLAPVESPSLFAQAVELGPGRPPSPDERHHAASSAARAAEHLSLIAIDDRANAGRVLQDRSMRRPFGAWPLTAMWTAKQVVRRLTQLAESFVFKSADERTAAQLQAVLELGLLRLARAGALAPMDNGQLAQVSASVERDRGAPALRAEVTVSLRPWITAVRVLLSLEADAPPRAALL